MLSIASSTKKKPAFCQGACCWCDWFCWWLKAFSCFNCALRLANLSFFQQTPLKWTQAFHRNVSLPRFHQAAHRSAVCPPLPALAAALAAPQPANQHGPTYPISSCGRLIFSNYFHRCRCFLEKVACSSENSRSSGNISAWGEISY